MTNGYVKSVPEIVAELKSELQEFVSTRVAIFRSEMQENIRSLKMTVPLLMVGLVLLWTAWLAFTGFLISIIAEAFAPSTWAYVASFILVAVGYALVGGIAAISAWKQMKQRGLKPERTIHVLQQDRIWMQTEGKAQL